MVDDTISSKPNLTAKATLKSGFQSALKGIFSAFEGASGSSEQGVSFKIPDINVADPGAQATRMPSEDPQKPEEQQLHLQQHSQAPATRIDGENLVKNLEKIHQGIIDYLGVIEKNTSSSFEYIEKKIKGVDASIVRLTEKTTKIEKKHEEHVSRFDRELKALKQSLTPKKSSNLIPDDDKKPDAERVDKDNIPNLKALLEGIGGGAITAAIWTSLIRFVPTVAILAASTKALEELLKDPLGALGLKEWYNAKGMIGELQELLQIMKSSPGGLNFSPIPKQSTIDEIKGWFGGKPTTPSLTKPGAGGKQGAMVPLLGALSWLTEGSKHQPVNDYSLVRGGINAANHPFNPKLPKNDPAAAWNILNRYFKSVPSGYKENEVRPTGSGNRSEYEFLKSLEKKIQENYNKPYSNEGGINVVGALNVSNQIPGYGPGMAQLSPHDLLAAMRAITAGKQAAGGPGSNIGGGGSGPTTTTASTRITVPLEPKNIQPYRNPNYDWNRPPGPGTNAGPLRERVLPPRNNFDNQQLFKGSDYLKAERSWISEELNGDPELKRTLRGVLAHEQSQGERSKVFESLANRLNMLRQKNPNLTLREYLSREGKQQFYGPLRHHQINESYLQKIDPYAASIDREINKVLAGSNDLRGMTDQGSAGDPNFGRGETIMSHGEGYNDFGGAMGQRYRMEQQRRVTEGGGLQERQLPDRNNFDATRQQQQKIGPDVEDIQRNRPEYARGSFSYKGKTYQWGSGGRVNPQGYIATMPYGDYPVGDTAGPMGRGGWGRVAQTGNPDWGALGINKNTIYDPQHQRQTGGIELHFGMDDKLLTQGCVAIAGNQWLQFKNAIKDAWAHGEKTYIHFHPDVKGTPQLSIDDKPGVGEATRVTSAQDLEKAIPGAAQVRIPQGYHFDDRIPAEMKEHVKNGVFQLPEGITPAMAIAAAPKAQSDYLKELDRVLKESLSKEHYDEWASTGRLDPAKLTNLEHNKMETISSPIASLVAPNPYKIETQPNETPTTTQQQAASPSSGSGSEAGIGSKLRMWQHDYTGQGAALTDTSAFVKAQLRGRYRPHSPQQQYDITATQQSTNEQQSSRSQSFGEWLWGKTKAAGSTIAAMTPWARAREKSPNAAVQDRFGEWGPEKSPNAAVQDRFGEWGPEKSPNAAVADRFGNWRPQQDINLFPDQQAADIAPATMAAILKAAPFHPAMIGHVLAGAGHAAQSAYEAVFARHKYPGFNTSGVQSAIQGRPGAIASPIPEEDLMRKAGADAATHGGFADYSQRAAAPTSPVWGETPHPHRPGGTISSLRIDRGKPTTEPVVADVEHQEFERLRGRSQGGAPKDTGPGRIISPQHRADDHSNQPVDQVNETPGNLGHGVRRDPDNRGICSI